LTLLDDVITTFSRCARQVILTVSAYLKNNYSGWRQVLLGLKHDSFIKLHRITVCNEQGAMRLELYY
jgi:hypothetical protein